MRNKTLVVGHGRGFTLVEVLIVVAILGLAGAFVVPYMLQASTLGVQAGARMVISDILIAQNDAIAQQANRIVVFDPDGNSYRMTDVDGNTLDVSWKTADSGGGNYVVDFDEDERFQGVVLENVDFGGDEPLQLEMDALGAPVGAGGTLDLVAGELRFRITVAPFTGRVTVAPVEVEVPEE